MINIYNFIDKYFYIYSDCFITNGARLLSILDVNRQKIYFMNTIYYDLFDMMSKYKIGEINSLLDSEEDVNMFHLFIKKMLNLDLGLFVDDISLFPPINVKWEAPSWATNSIIDIRHIFHDFEMIANELNKCRCKHIQIRAYEPLELSQIQKIALSFKDKSVLSINLLLKYNYDSDFLKELFFMIKNNALLHLTLYGAPKENVKEDKEKRIKIISNIIGSCNDCGKISKESFVQSPIGTIQTFMENKLYNGCLNKKISVDENGDIKNCPSMKRDFGNIRNTSIFEVSQMEEFTMLWTINKTQIKVCKDCEYRCICTDCRAFLENPEDIFSKPSKCSYNPYLSKW